MSVVQPKATADGNPTNLRHCTLPGCRRMFYARGMCYADYQRWSRAGKPDHLLPPRAPRQRLPASFRRTTG